MLLLLAANLIMIIRMFHGQRDILLATPHTDPLILSLSGDTATDTLPGRLSFLSILSHILSHVLSHVLSHILSHILSRSLIFARLIATHLQLDQSTDHHLIVALARSLHASAELMLPDMIVVGV